MPIHEAGKQPKKQNKLDEFKSKAEIRESSMRRTVSAVIKKRWAYVGQVMRRSNHSFTKQVINWETSGKKKKKKKPRRDPKENTDKSG